jgi:iron complex outermembrane receptor protein
LAVRAFLQHRFYFRGKNQMLKLAKLFRFLLPISAVVLVAPGLTSVAQAQEGADEVIEEIITTGTRRAQRSAADSSIPIDVISGGELENVGTADLDDMLKTVVPSYNVDRHEISDAATLVRPATLRGLPPDNVLIMVKRRHRSGVIAELGGNLAEGSQGADLSAIPALAIKQAEILRDGAAAQYGSDAIAGVMNFILRDDADGMTLEARTGEFMEGDGTLVQLMGNIGLPLGNDGFLNVTGSWSEQDPTSRSTQRTDAATLIAAGNTDIRQPYAQIWGGPEYRDNWNIFANSAIQLNDSQEIYAFGNFGRLPQPEQPQRRVYARPRWRDRRYHRRRIREQLSRDRGYEHRGGTDGAVLRLPGAGQSRFRQQWCSAGSCRSSC